MTTRVVVASRNPVKLRSVAQGFGRMFPGTAFDLVAAAVPSGVGQQPMTDVETLFGAQTRAENAAAVLPEADFWVGIEGGLQSLDGEWTSFSWVVVRSHDKVGRGRSATYFLPAVVAALVQQGVELGEADDRVFGRSNSKQENGAVGILTGDVIDRTALYEQAVILALIPFKNELLYGG